MSWFAGVSVIDGNKKGHLETSGVFAGEGADSGYHLLTIKGYSRCKKDLSTGKSACTEGFTVGGHFWFIDYYPNGKNPSCADFISLSITRDFDPYVEVGVKAKFSFSLVDEVEKQTPTYIRATSKTHDFSRCYPCWGCDKFVRRETLERSPNLKYDCFTIRCDIMDVNDPNCKGDDTDGTDTKIVLLLDIHGHFSHLLQNKVGADVTFEAGGEMFSAHRCVLAARSTVFMAQLFGPMNEGTTTSNSVIQIKDMKAKVFEALLSFIYTDSFPLMEDSMAEDEMPWRTAWRHVKEAALGKMSEAVEQTEEDETWLQWLQDLFEAADRYNLQRLKFICEKQLSEHMVVSSVASTLALAEQHHCRGLKEACLKFIQVQSPSRLQTLMATNGWGHIVTTYPSVVNKLIANLASNQRK